MALFMKPCMFGEAKRSYREIIKLKYIFNDALKSSVVESKKLSPVFTRWHGFSTNNDPKLNEPEIEIEKVYIGPLAKQIRSIKTFTLLSSTTGICAQPVLLAKVQELGSSIALIGVGTFWGFFVLVTPLLIHTMTKRYVIDLDYDPKTDKYIAYTYSFFIRRKKIEFTPEDVKIPLAGVFTTAIVKGKPLFMDPKMFYNLDHYSKIMGYDKPIDLSLDSDQEDQKK